MSVRRRIVARGRVQGVYFRETTRREAERRGVAGWVANRPDGSVEVVAEGPADALKELVGHLNVGPPAASVRRVDVVTSAPRGDLLDFRVRSGAHPGD